MKQYDAISLVTMTTLEVTSLDLIRYILVWKICGVQSGNSWGSERWRVSPLHYNVINHMTCHVFLVAVITMSGDTFIWLYSGTATVAIT